MISEISFNLEQDRLIETDGKLELWQIGRVNLPYFTRFVFDVYAADFAKRYGWESTDADFAKMLEEDEAFFPRSICFAFKLNTGEIIGTCKVTHKGEYYLFPIETKFNINLLEIEKKGELSDCIYWHGGRLAVDVEKLKLLNTDINSRKMLKEIFSASFRYMVEFSSRSVLLTEFDVRVYNLSRAMGANFQAVNEGMYYLGSHTYPAYITADDMSKWLEEKIFTQDPHVREKLSLY